VLSQAGFDVPGAIMDVKNKVAGFAV